MEQLSVGDLVRVWPGQWAGIDYLATVERINGDRATVRPVDVALSKPAWCDSRRARSVRLSKLTKINHDQKEA